MTIKTERKNFTMTPFRAALKRHGLGISEFARLTDYTRASVSRWANGHEEPPRPILVILAALDDGQMTVEWLRAAAQSPGD